jgi:hypothetical protein
MLKLKLGNFCSALGTTKYIKKFVNGKIITIKNAAGKLVKMQLVIFKMKCYN